MLKKEFRRGSLRVYDFDQDDEIEIEIDDSELLGNPISEHMASVYLSRADTIKFCDWLTEQIKNDEEKDDETEQDTLAAALVRDELMSIPDKVRRHWRNVRAVREAGGSL